MLLTLRQQAQEIAECIASRARQTEDSWFRPLSCSILIDPLASHCTAYGDDLSKSTLRKAQNT